MSKKFTDKLTYHIIFKIFECIEESIKKCKVCRPELSATLEYRSYFRAASVIMAATAKERQNVIY